MRASCNCNGKTWTPNMLGTTAVTPGAMPTPISSQDTLSYSQMSDGDGRVRGGRFTTHAQAMEARRKGMFMTSVALVVVALVALVLWKR